jgi:hypothetical protein
MTGCARYHALSQHANDLLAPMAVTPRGLGESVRLIDERLRSGLPATVNARRFPIAGMQLASASARYNGAAWPRYRAAWPRSPCAHAMLAAPGSAISCAGRAVDRVMNLTRLRPSRARTGIL